MPRPVDGSCAGAPFVSSGCCSTERLDLDAEEMGYEVLHSLSNSGGGLGLWATHLTGLAGATDSKPEGRSRGLFPLPMPASCQRLVRNAKSSSTGGRPHVPSSRSKTPKRTGHLSWLAVLIIALNWFAFGCLSNLPLITPRSAPTAAQSRALNHLTELRQRFVEPDAESFRLALPLNPSWNVWVASALTTLATQC